jgi:hypothetical protein
MARYERFPATASAILALLLPMSALEFNTLTLAALQGAVYVL